MITADQNKRNLATASRNVAARLGVDPANLSSYEIRVQYNKELAAEILKYPQSFTEGTLESARIVSEKTYSDLQDASFSWGDFGDALAEEAKVTLPAVGNKLLIGAVVVAAVYFAVRAWKSAPAAVKV